MNGKQGECLPYYLCKNDKIITGEETKLDIRLTGKFCQDTFETCCETGEISSEPLFQVAPLRGAAQCGKRNPAGVVVRITGQTDGESEFGEFPWMVALLNHEPIGNFYYNVYKCGGSLIHPSVVLTGKISFCFSKILIQRTSSQLHIV